ncbi:hypothetical protein [[Clostridium] polysaccharolyticum]|uniref:Uncharacterized protein n=1 Tax=[Clostridium] polysaccharolyticum TaxID=29364 RepID=A0A1H9YHR8_9FIRM|nr:hypothetical protein [[Clostridium] polysaccharolyticum]SES68605.1 hypothetical protein SAMN04487772_10229 [[Clostridium] polysaccharolyticum]
MDKKSKETKFTKEQILNSKRYESKKDLVNAVLDDNGSFSLSEVEKLINDYLKKEVK